MYPPGETLRGPTFPPSYEPIDREIEKGLISDAINANPELADSSAPYVLMTFDGNSPYANVARSLECKVFDTYFQNNPEEMQQEYSPYEGDSTFFLMVDRENLEPAGVMRITHNGPEGFKSSNDLPTSKCQTSEGQPVTSLSTAEIFPEFGMTPENTLDVATIAANPKYAEKSTGSPIVLASLMRAVYKYSIDNGYDLMAIIDQKPLERLQSVGLPIDTSENIASDFEYLGATGNTFIHIPIPEVERSVSSKGGRELFDYIFGEAALMGECELSFIKQ